MKKDLSCLLSPRSIAVVGASERFGAGSNAIENLRLIGFDGPDLSGQPELHANSWADLLPDSGGHPSSEDIDCVAILLGSQMIMPVLEQAAAARNSCGVGVCKRLRGGRRRRLPGTGTAQRASASRTASGSADPTASASPTCTPGCAPAALRCLSGCGPGGFQPSPKAVP